MKYKTVCYAVINGEKWLVTWFAESFLILKPPVSFGWNPWCVKSLDYSGVDRIIVREELA